MKWQIGEYNRSMEFKTLIPYQFLLLCKIVNVTPKEMLLDFMDNLSCGSWRREGRDEINAKLVEYFILHQYGHDDYTIDEIREIFKEMDAQGALYPKNGNENIVDLHVKWRDKYQKYWSKKWFYKGQRRLKST